MIKMNTRVGIKKQVWYLVLSCSIITLVIAGGIALFGMMRIKSNAVQIGVDIGNYAAENSSVALKDVSLKSLQGLMNEKTKQINNFFGRHAGEVSILANEMTQIMQNPQNYPQRNVSAPDRNNAGKNVPQLQYRAGADRAALAYEVGLTANLQDFQVRFFDNDDTIGSNYVASANGFNITVDAASDRRVDANNVPAANDYSSRPWYVNAIREKKLTFTDIFVDAHGRGLAMGCSAPYFDASGNIAGVVGEGKFLTAVNQVVQETKMGETGYAFVLNNKTGQILFSSKKDGLLTVDNDNNLGNDLVLFDVEDKNLSQVIKKMAAGENGLELVNIDGTPCYLAYQTLENVPWSFGAVIEESEVVAVAKLSQEEIEQNTDKFVDSLNESILLMIGAIVAAFLAIVGLSPLAGKKVADELTKPLLQLSDGVREIASGNWDKKLDIQTGNEIEHLAVCFNAMTDELKAYTDHLTKIAAEKERIATELNVATNIQESMLPHIFPPFPDKKEFDLYATMHAAKEVGGDFYDFYLLDNNHLIVTIADVSGKGVPAALFMVISKTILKNFALTMSGTNDLAPLVSCTNDQLCENNDAMMFVTAFVGMLELSTGKFYYVNAGHNPPLVYRASENRFTYMNVERNFVMGGMDELNFKGQEMTLSPGDKLFLYTDGVTEALDPEQELYGEQRLLDALNGADAGNISLEDLLAKVRESLDAHVKTAAQSDDITMVALSYNGVQDVAEKAV